MKIIIYSQKLSFNFIKKYKDIINPISVISNGHLSKKQLYLIYDNISLYQETCIKEILRK